MQANAEANKKEIMESQEQVKEKDEEKKESSSNDAAHYGKTNFLKQYIK